jgi:hypothetical protein
MANVHDHDAEQANGVSGVTDHSCPLPILQAGGFGASVDAFAWEPDPESSLPKMRLWVVSLLGSQQAVKALWAQLIKGDTATLSDPGAGARFCTLPLQATRSWRFFRASLPASSGYHGILVPEVALFATECPEFLILKRGGDDAARLHYRFLNRRVSLPLHPSWAEWLWERALRTGEARALKSFGMETYRCIPDEAALGSDLTAAIRDGALLLNDDRSSRPDHIVKVTDTSGRTHNGKA